MLVHAPLSRAARCTLYWQGQHKLLALSACSGGQLSARSLRAVQVLDAWCTLQRAAQQWQRKLLGLSVRLGGQLSAYLFKAAQAVDAQCMLRGVIDDKSSAPPNPVGPPKASAGENSSQEPGQAGEANCGNDEGKVVVVGGRDASLTWECGVSHRPRQGSTECSTICKAKTSSITDESHELRTGSEVSMATSGKSHLAPVLAPDLAAMWSRIIAHLLVKPDLQLGKTLLPRNDSRRGSGSKYQLCPRTLLLPSINDNVNLPKLVALSQATQLYTMRTTQATGHKLMVLNGHPANLVGPPITVYHPVFAEFITDTLSNEPVPDTMYKTTSNFALFSRELHPKDGQAGKIDADLPKLSANRSGELCYTQLTRKWRQTGSRGLYWNNFPTPPKP
ncbi:hypothetical protein DFH09DRAFT_1109718 [Mycena vulgaris]|nr:hypothetical protein DFH09DRAFT_1109718 [Mycena vulgaris]